MQEAVTATRLYQARNSSRTGTVWWLCSVPRMWPVTEQTSLVCVCWAWGWVKGGLGLQGARHQPSCRNSMVSSPELSRLGFPEPLCKGSGRSRERDLEPSPPPCHSQLSIRGRLSPLLCGKEAGAVSILFHIHHALCPTGREKPQEMHSFSPNEAFQKQGGQETSVRTS